MRGIKTARKKKAAFKRKYREFYLDCRRIAAGDSHSPDPLCITRGNLLPKATEPSKPLRHVGTKHLALKRKPSKFFKREKREREEQKQASKATASPDESALQGAPFLAAAVVRRSSPFLPGQSSSCRLPSHVSRTFRGGCSSEGGTCSCLG